MPAPSGRFERQGIEMSSVKPPHAADAGYNPDDYWDATSQSYAHYPTIRHRRRWVRNCITRLTSTIDTGAPVSVFDHGCGNGQLLAHLAARLPPRPWVFSGCEISAHALDEARRAVPQATFHQALRPTLHSRPDIIISSEVLEHTRDYRVLLAWMADQLAPGGHLLVTTQAGRIHASDRYTGHTQHFQRSELAALVEEAGLQVASSRQWGFPFFSAQKFLTNVRFDSVRGQVLEGPLTARKRVLFALATAAFYLHDPIRWGPQLYLVARRRP